MTQRLEPDRAAWLLAFDIAELAVLLFLTGGLQNPFAFMFLGPVLLSATALPPRFTLLLGGFAVACATILVFAHYPLPWDSDDPLQLPPIYMMGVWLCILLAIGFIGVYAWQITEESRQLSDALAATELVLAREQHLSQLDGLAAAAAHELGTPLSTISVIAKELERAIAPNAPHGDDVRLLREQATRCRHILAKLTELSAGGEPFDRMPLTALIEEVVAPHRNFGVDHRRDHARRSRHRAGRRPQSRHPVRAGQSAGKRGRFCGRSGGGRCAMERRDRRGHDQRRRTGICAGNPRAHRRALHHHAGGIPRPIPDDESAGLGLGFFIAKTLLERSGATLSFENRPLPERGAIIRLRLEPQRFRATINIGGDLSGSGKITISCGAGDALPALDYAQGSVAQVIPWTLQRVRPPTWRRKTRSPANDLC